MYNVWDIFMININWKQWICNKNKYHTINHQQRRNVMLARIAYIFVHKYSNEIILNLNLNTPSRMKSPYKIIT